VLVERGRGARRAVPTQRRRVIAQIETFAHSAKLIEHLRRALESIRRIPRERLHHERDDVAAYTDPTPPIPSSASTRHFPSIVVPTRAIASARTAFESSSGSALMRTDYESDDLARHASLRNAPADPL
jgi:hypothetical protein